MHLKNKVFQAKKFPWYRPLIWLLYALAISILYANTNWIKSIPLAIPSIIGTAISLFLGFRTNSSYQRWWEARKIWGEIVNNSRTLARQILTFGDASKNIKIRKSIVYRQIYWCWILAHKLRKLPLNQDQNKYLDSSEEKEIENSTNVPNKVLFNQQIALSKLLQDGSINDFDFRKIDGTLKLLCDSMGKCERIKNTEFPTQYSLYTRVFLYVFLILFPLAIVESMGYYTVLIQFLTGFTFIMIQNIAFSLQDPFENNASDIPVFAISRTIERNLLEMTGEKNLPEDWKAENNVLM